MNEGLKRSPFIQKKIGLVRDFCLALSNGAFSKKKL